MSRWVPTREATMDDRSLTTSEIHARRSPVRKSAFVVVLGLLLGGLALMEGTGTAQRAPASRAAVGGRCAAPGAPRSNTPSSLGRFGGDDRTRTGDPLLAKQVL